MSLWFRFYTDALHKAKIQNLSPALFKHWVNLICIAKEHDQDGGSLPEWAEIAFGLRVSEDEAVKITGDLTSRKLIDVYEDTLIMHDWNEHQYVSDNSTQRVRKHRAKQVKQLGNVSETVQSRADTEQKQRREEQKPAAKARAAPSLSAVVIELQALPAYSTLDVKHEADKCSAYWMTRGKSVSKKSLVNWLNRADAPLFVNGHGGPRDKHDIAKEKRDEHFVKILKREGLISG